MFIIQKDSRSGGFRGGRSVGGLVGGNWGSISNSYSTSVVTGYSRVGGLAGANIEGRITNCYSTLLELIKDPKATRDDIVLRCRGTGVMITRILVDVIFGQYDLDKKRAR